MMNNGFTQYQQRKHISSLIKLFAFAAAFFLVLGIGKKCCYGGFTIGASYGVEAPSNHWDSEDCDHNTWNVSLGYQQDLNDRYWMEVGMVYRKYKTTRYEVQTVQTVPAGNKIQCLPEPDPLPEPEPRTVVGQVRRSYSADSYGIDLWLKGYVYKKLYLGVMVGTAYLSRDHPDLEGGFLGTFGGCGGIRLGRMGYEVVVKHASNPFERGDGLNTLEFRVAVYF